MSMLGTALEYCKLWHGEQKRKYTGEPYWTHPVAVKNILMDMHINEEDILCAALLHDTVEDCNVDPAHIATIFNRRIMELVMEVTDASKPSDGNRAKRKEIDRVHLSKASIEGKLIKCADTLHNTLSIMEYDKNFAKVYIPEKLLVLPLIHVEHPLWQRVDSLVKRHAIDLGIQV